MTLPADLRCLEVDLPAEQPTWLALQALQPDGRVPSGKNPVACTGRLPRKYDSVPEKQGISFPEVTLVRWVVK